MPIGKPFDVAAAVATILTGGLAGVSDFEGGLGMLAAWGIGPIGGLVGLVCELGHVAGLGIQSEAQPFPYGR